MKPSKITIEIDPALKSAAEKAAAENNRSLNGLIEELLNDFCKKRARTSASSKAQTEEAPKAAEMASRTIDAIADQTLPSEERQQRKRRLIRGPKEFRDLRIK